MKHKNSLAFRLTVMVLVLLLVTIGAMMFLTKFQMDAHFSQYLYNSSHMMGQARGMHGMMHGPAETVYLSSVHSSLFWLGFGMALLSALICFLMVREALRPLKDLTQAARSIKKGRYDQHGQCPSGLVSAALAQPVSPSYCLYNLSMTGSRSFVNAGPSPYPRIMLTQRFL